MDWKKAEKHLRNLISEYTEIGVAGNIALEYAFKPLLKRFESGERTQDLYNEITVCE